jgi:hypothetical protein
MAGARRGGASGPGFAEGQAPFAPAPALASTTGDPGLVAMLRAAEAHLARAGIGSGPRSRMLGARVEPALLEAAARRLGTENTSEVVAAGLALLAGVDTYGAWLVGQAGTLPADLDVDV